jgi:hypothetical protein
MPVPWPAIFKAIPWGEVVAAAPKVLDQAKKLVAAARRTDSGSSAGAEASVPAQAGDSALPAIEARLSSVEGKIEDMAQEALSAAELVKSLAEQNAQLIQAVQILSSKVRRLNLIVVALLCIVIGGSVIWQLLSR